MAFRIKLHDSDKGAEVFSLDAPRPGEVSEYDLSVPIVLRRVVVYNSGPIEDPDTIEALKKRIAELEEQLEAIRCGCGWRWT